MVKKKEETKIDPNKCKINCNYFSWPYYDEIIKITTRNFLIPSELTATSTNNQAGIYLQDEIIPFKRISKLQIYLNTLKNMNTLYKIFKNFELKYKTYKEDKLEILMKYSKLIDDQYVLMEETTEGKQAKKEIKILENQIIVLPFDKIDPNYFIFTFHHLFQSFASFLPGTRVAELRGFDNITEKNIITNEPFYTIHIFDFLYDIFDMNKLEVLEIDKKMIQKTYSELT